MNDRPRWAAQIGALAATAFALTWAMYPGFARSAIHPEATRFDSSSWSAQAEVGMMQGYVPPFRASERSRMTAGGRAFVRPAPPVELDLSWAYLADDFPSGETVSGPGDVALGLTVEKVMGGLEIAGGWRVKLPNARDEGELGSDETDVQLLGTVGHRFEHWAIRASAGLDIRGDPIRFANQDDIAQVWLSALGQHQSMHLSGRVGGDLPTARSPSRMQAVAGLTWARSLHIGTEIHAGLSPAAPDWGGRLFVGWGARAHTE